MRDNEQRIFTVDYTGRDQQTIKRNLETYSENYYPDIAQNKNEGSLESLLFDTVTYIGDNLSLYIDYQANEMLFQNSDEFDNIREIGKQHGFKLKGRPISFGMQTFYVIVPASSNSEGPDYSYIPILKNGTQVLSESGGIYTLLEDVHFTNSEEIVVAETDNSTGLPISFAIKSYGRIASGEQRTKEIVIEDYERFLQIEFTDEDFSEIISVVDSEGNIWYEVDSLTQDVIYKSIPNFNKNNNEPDSLLRPFVVPRRFVSEFDSEVIKMQFGTGTTSNIRSINRLDPSQVVLQKHGKNYISDLNLDPTNLISSDSLGLVPSNTTLYITYRANTDISSNAAIGSVNNLIEPLVEFANRQELDETQIFSVINSFETENENPIVGEVLDFDQRDLKHKIKGQFSSQKRAVHATDYVAICYNMPSSFGAIKRTSVVVDPRSKKRNLNLFVISEDSDGNLLTTNNIIKENLKIWLNQYKMVNDTIDILDAKVVNIGIEFEIMSVLNENKYDILNRAYLALSEYFEIKMDIGESLSLTDLYKVLRDTDGVVDILNLKIKNKTGSNYSTVYLDIEEQTSFDGRYVFAPKNVIFELKYPNDDIKGSVR